MNEQYVYIITGFNWRETNGPVRTHLDHYLYKQLL